MWVQDLHRRPAVRRCQVPLLIPALLPPRVSRLILDLQLPLYKMLLPLDPVFRAMHPEIDLEKCRIRCGYFRIPGDIGKIGYDFWDDMDQYDDAAEKTVRQVIETVKKMKSGILPENLDRSIQYDFVKELFPLGLKKTFEGSFRTDPPPEPPDMPKPEKKGKKE